MIKIITLAFSFALLSLPLAAQQGDELLVYAVKGEVYSIFNNKESPVKIGKVLKPEATIKMGKGASVTMLCSKGKPISLTTEGKFPVTRWKDSCRVTTGSISSSYFKYIWNQLYAYSPEHKEEMKKKSDMAVRRGDEPTGTAGKKKPKLEFSSGMDTLKYTGNDFPLSWNGVHYTGKYIFSLYDAKGKLLYKDSTRFTYINTESIKYLLKEGNTYRWTIGGRGLPVSRKRVLRFVAPQKAADHLDRLLLPVAFPEDSAAAFFRIAYMLERSHYLAEAYNWYQKANDASDPEIDLYRDQLIRFRNEFWIR